jgi:hypothetical protein
MAPPIITWALTDTLKGAITFGSGLLKAATSDNVSPLALMACESFGSLLPACPVTRLKIEQLARRNQTSHVLKFINAQIGYMEGDSVEVLSESDGGVRFLCLVATFRTMGRYEAALRIDSLLEATRDRDKLRPTLTQLQSIMAILESKLALSDFTASVAGWEVWLLGQLLRSRDDLFRPHAYAIPPKRSLQELILLMSETSRLGEEQNVLIRSNSSYVPWLIAFIKWLLGDPPFVQLATGRVLNDQKNPQILLIVVEQLAHEERLQLFAEGSKVTELHISAAYCNKGLKSFLMENEKGERLISWQGLMTTSDSVSYKLRSVFYRFPEGNQNQELLEIVAQVIYFIVEVVPNRTNFGWKEGKASHEIRMNGGRMRVQTAPFHPHFVYSPFPDAQERIALARELLGTQLPFVLPSDDSAQNSQLKVLIDQKMHMPQSLAVVELGADLMLLSLFGTNSRIMPMVMADE